MADLMGMSIDILFKIVGVFGIIAIILGVSLKNRSRALKYFVAGGVLLTAYSVYVRDIIFIILQVVYTIVALHELIELGKSGKK